MKNWCVKTATSAINLLLGGGNSNMFYFHPYLGKMKFPFWRIFFNWVESTNCIKTRQVHIMGKFWQILICFSGSIMRIYLPSQPRMPLNARIITIFRLRHPDTREPSHISYLPAIWVDDENLISWEGFLHLHGGLRFMLTEFLPIQIILKTLAPIIFGGWALVFLPRLFGEIMYVQKKWQVAQNWRFLLNIAGGFLHLVSSDFPKILGRFSRRTFFQVETIPRDLVNFFITCNWEPLLLEHSTPFLWLFCCFLANPNKWREKAPQKGCAQNVDFKTMLALVDDKMSIISSQNIVSSVFDWSELPHHIYTENLSTLFTPQVFWISFHLAFSEKTPPKFLPLGFHQQPRLEAWCKGP